MKTCLFSESCSTLDNGIPDEDSDFDDNNDDGNNNNNHNSDDDNNDK